MSVVESGYWVTKLVPAWSVLKLPAVAAPFRLFHCEPWAPDQYAVAGAGVTPVGMY